MFNIFDEDIKKQSNLHANPSPSKRPKTGYENEPTEQLLEILVNMPEGLARQGIETELKFRGDLPDLSKGEDGRPAEYEKWDTPRLLKAFNAMAQGPSKALVAEVLKSRNALPEGYRPPPALSAARQTANASLNSPPPGVSSALKVFGVLGIIAGVLGSVGFYRGPDSRRGSDGRKHTGHSGGLPVIRCG